MASTRPRLWRLQFSLRTLLSAILLTSLALVLYRWPWSVNHFKLRDAQNREGVGIITFRRGWNGHPEREREVELYLQDRLAIDRRFAGGQLVAERHFENGQLKAALRQGKLHTVKIPPQAADTISGVWQCSHTYFNDVVHERTPWRNGERHGLATWRSGGTLLQSAEFKQGRIIRWNGLPIDSALQQWLKTHVNAEQERDSLCQNLVGQAEFANYKRPFGAYYWRNHNFLMVHYLSPWEEAWLKPPQWQPSFSVRPMLEVLLEGALNQSSTLNYRYGRVCVVPIRPRNLHWKDPTGCDKITFSDPRLHGDWEGLSAPYEFLEKQPAQHLKMICRNTQLSLDTTQVDQLDGLPNPKGGFNAPAEPRKFVIARILNAAVYRVELRDQTLVVLPPRK